MNLFDLVAVIRLDKSEYEEGLTTLGNKAKSALATAGKAAAAGAAVAAAGAVAIGKEAVQAYADYEQLVGGVDTLFKESSAMVQEYANNAFRTAGLSANQYMETVTSFSASLLQSLGGDTEAAASIADMAIIDMADNANKMGTAMESIQAAYQGFAKQNYTMLDNLKLGYGGTKTEMERLLKDATAISGVQYDIDSLADVYEAIHVIQEELDIAGTTSREASETISGSLAATKSAWQNLLVGIADENANFGDLVNNFVESAVTAGENLIPRIEQALNGIGSLVSGLAPVITEAIPPMVQNVLPTLIAAAFTMLETVGGALMENLPMIVETGLQVILSLADGISNSLPELIPAVVETVLKIVQTLIDNAPALIESAVQIIVALAEGLVGAIPLLVEYLPQIIDSAVKALIVLAPELIKAALRLMITLGVGLIQAIPQLIKNIPQIIKAIVGGLLDGVAQIREIGSKLLTGLWNGISDKVAWLKGKVSGVVNKIKSWFTGKDGFDEHSPSRWAADVFEKLMEGGERGLAAGERGLMQSVAGVVGSVQSGLQPSLAFGGVTSGGMSSDASRPIELTISLNGKTLARELYEDLQNESSRMGRRLVSV